VTGRLLNIAVVFVIAIGLTACGGALRTKVFDDSFWTASPMKGNQTAELGMAELAKGNYIAAESEFQKALQKNPQDIHALLGLGMIYQNNGQVTKSRQMYEAILAIRPDDSEQFVIWKGLATRPISEIASVNLALMESGGVLNGMGQDQGMGMGQSAPQQPMMTAPTGTAMTARTMPMQAPIPDAALPRFTEADANIVSRFKTMISLRDQGLLTHEEFNTRRQANIGALLPLTSPPPASGLDRPVPGTEQISGRLRAIGRGLEMRAISVAQHSAERSMILDALMPAAPVSVANPGTPPQGLLEAADAVRWLEQLNEEGLITSDEYASERMSIELAMQPRASAQPQAAMPMAAPSMSMAEQQAGAPNMLSGPQPAVHLASYRSQKDAERGWAQLRRAFNDDLGGLVSEISEVNLGDKGIFFRLKAGPLPDKAESKALCGRLKALRQFCEPSSMNAG